MIHLAHQENLHFRSARIKSTAKAFCFLPRCLNTTLSCLPASSEIKCRKRRRINKMDWLWGLSYVTYQWIELPMNVDTESSFFQAFILLLLKKTLSGERWAYNLSFTAHYLKYWLPRNALIYFLRFTDKGFSSYTSIDCLRESSRCLYSESINTN